jgi:DNA-binding SARP family transcriptional activator
LTISKPAAQNTDAERFNLRKLNELEGREQYRIKISNRFTVLEILNDNEDIQWVWENIKESIKT